MKATFVETTGFTASLSDYLPDRAYSELQRQLMAHSDAGDVMPGCGGLRKLRTADTTRNKGKRGGARVIYLHVPLADRFYLIDIYGKDEKDDLSVAEKKQLRRLAEHLKQTSIATHQKWIKENE